MAAKKAGSNRPKTEVLQFRLDPKLRYAAELTARMQRRSLSNFAEWAFEEAVRNYKAPGTDGPTARQIVDEIWDVDEADRFVKLATRYPGLLTHNEQVLWKVIREMLTGPGGQLPDAPEEVLFRTEEGRHFLEILREQWGLFSGVISGEVTPEEARDRFRLFIVQGIAKKPRGKKTAQSAEGSQ